MENLSSSVLFSSPTLEYFYVLEEINSFGIKMESISLVNSDVGIFCVFFSKEKLTYLFSSLA